MSYDYAINVYYGEKYICSLVAKHAGGYDNVIWWQLDQLINKYKNMNLTKELFQTGIEDNGEYFHFINDDLSNKEIFKVDFLNSLISLPTHPIYTFDEFKIAWGDVAEILKEEDIYYIIYEESEKYILNHIEYDEQLLMKDIVTFDEFQRIYDFYSSLMDEDNEYILNGTKVIKFNII